ncbi:sirohydrochlorin chelatase [Gordonia neofelifaecis]|uniref:Cobalamin (Vitamin B12) biosynthesis CbiX protein n=1 Tax=Gordonia neofelifaecis NRRL B-59395 TaxID=644548 RepID=F1YDT9_9ACTN|nr:CbiX/SirB N-terminal domain-containing protein [Gordonia neofelifaecis]EGD57029.1 cobalamin (vitamin B12) biosynthesis CbiX protein [Gordonia neofelifaecis NRRL B-59395]
MTTLVLAAHGSRDPRFDVTARRVADAVRIALPGVRVELAYLDLTAPLLTDVLGELTSEAVVVPLLFGDGYHSKVDLPALIDDVRVVNSALHVVQTPVVGRYSPVPALVDRLSEVGLGPRDGVLMPAVGSSDAGSDASVIERGHELAGVLGRPVHTLFATRLGPGGAALRDAVDALLAGGAERVAVSPLFLSAGLLTDRVERHLDAMNVPVVVAGPVADHPCLVAGGGPPLPRRHGRAAVRGCRGRRRELRSRTKTVVRLTPNDSLV